MRVQLPPPALEDPSKTIKMKMGFTLIELLVTIAIISILSGIMLAAVRNAIRKAETTEAESELRQISIQIRGERLSKDKVLKDITGSNCSDCACRSEPDLKNPSDSCRSRTETSFERVGIEKLLKDPWGSFSYFIDENELEFSSNLCRQDSLRSAGPDRRLGTGDDIWLRLPFYSAQCY